MTQVAYVGLGSNLGDCQENLSMAMEALGRIEQTQVLRRSSWCWTKPLGGMDQPTYLNGVVQLSTSLEPEQLLTALQTIEQGMGRQRSSGWESRTIDLDLLLMGKPAWILQNWSFRIHRCICVRLCWSPWPS